MSLYAADDEKKERQKLCIEYKKCMKKCQKSYSPVCEELCEQKYPCEAEVEQKVIKE